MRACVGAALAGVLIGLLILVVGVTTAAWLAIGLSVVAIILGARDYVKSHRHG